MAAVNSVHQRGVVMDATSLASLSTLSPHEAASTVALSPDGRWVATGSAASRDVFLWEAATGLRCSVVRDGLNWHVAFSPDSRWLAAFRRTCGLYEAGSWKPGPILPLANPSPVGSTAGFAPDSHSLAFVVEETETDIFSLPEAKLLAALVSPDGARIQKIEFSPEGSEVALACELGQVQLWDLRRLREALRERGLDWDAAPIPPTPPRAGSLDLQILGN